MDNLGTSRSPCRAAFRSIRPAPSRHTWKTPVRAEPHAADAENGMNAPLVAVSVDPYIRGTHA
ncbi:MULTISPECIES: hypothetical protein [Burkholderia]|uniref:hypothetical protein n=1 Tax=Burkholderia TaxID=32008 RepID=UPI0012E39F17|nr:MULTISPECIES: hypothetical protein [Burkholderia]